MEPESADQSIDEAQWHSDMDFSIMAVRLANIYIYICIL